MLSYKVHKVFATVLMLTILIVFCAPTETEARRVIFYTKASVNKGQLFATSPKMEPCPKCQMRDHRGRCRRVISFKPDEKC
ncbi:uncharacterized protein LOC119612073 [Lucilia sericata]|uniref:uncharacterized protein LOC119612073 n=1 Tax=Lucilia sericata TaxID=13632 RepID=UPI0018A80349|nr:uncharacterized protein LOC119612073 [Lucilia sericata]